ncbi:MAG: 50S ribosomal protein L3 [Omnitrophica WOR_2 bacterium RIFCSPHIGHO2_02_FULL_68_15]|nr:MAG: 50S ribosomal protein L3 [Omnitrophica WOR_2 bacterium RIFCSPHIGHO2_02_FULL_68_15]
MALGLLGKKLGMTQLFLPDGRPVGVTVIEAGPCPVLSVRTLERDGYRAVQLGFDDRPARLTPKPEQGQAAKAGTTPKRLVREIRLSPTDEAPTAPVTVAAFTPGDFVDVVGTTIGKGFQGGMKRHHWRGGGASHGSMSHRRIGSMGANTDPGRVLKGHRLPGHMGHARRTTQNLEVVTVDAERHLLVVKGSVPGPENGYLMVRKALKRLKRVVPPVVAKKKKKDTGVVKQSKGQKADVAAQRAKGKGT